MYLGIDISEKNIIYLLFFTDQAEQSLRVEATHRELLATIDLFLQQYSLTVSDIRGIAIVSGEGSFTSSRISAVIGNMFAYTKRIPIIGIEKSAWESCAENAERLQKRSVGEYLPATYRSEPNITSPV